MEVKNVDAAVYESLQKEALPSQLTAANEMLDAYVTDIQGTPADPNLPTTCSGTAAAAT
ncbi:MAG: hypothetical protein ACLUNZ_11190 [Evtepia sp.]